MVSSPPPRQNYNQSKRLPIDLILLDKCPQLLLNNSIACQYPRYPIINLCYIFYQKRDTVVSIWLEEVGPGSCASLINLCGPDLIPS